MSPFFEARITNVTPSLRQELQTLLLLEFYSLVISSFILWKYHRYLQPKHLIISGGLCGLYTLSEVIHPTTLSIFNIILVFLSACAVMAVFAQKRRQFFSAAPPPDRILGLFWWITRQYRHEVERLTVNISRT